MLSDLECTDTASVRAVACTHLAHVQLAMWLTARQAKVDQEKATLHLRLRSTQRGNPKSLTLATEKRHLRRQLKRLKSPETALVPCSGNASGRAVQRRLKTHKQHWNLRQICWGDKIQQLYKRYGLGIVLLSSPVLDVNCLRSVMDKAFQGIICSLGKSECFKHFVRVV